MSYGLFAFCKRLFHSVAVNFFFYDFLYADYDFFFQFGLVSSRIAKNLFYVAKFYYK